MEARPDVSVIVPARDAAPTIGRALEALQAQELRGTFEVIVIDDGSRDRTAAIVAAFEPFARLLRSPVSEGPGAARNRGATVARAPVLAFTDADCFPARDWLARGLDALAGADLVQGAVGPDPLAPRSPFDRTVVVDRDGGYYQTANLFVRRELFDAVGGFRDWSLDWRSRERPLRGRPSRDCPSRDRSRLRPDRRRARAARTPIGEDTLFGWTARRIGARSAFAGDALVHHAVAPGDLRDEIADRWHWARDMPGLARRVPELRERTFYRRWFFHRKTARFDAAVAGVAMAILMRRAGWLIATAPYIDWIGREAARWGPRRAGAYAVGSVAADTATLAGLLAGSASWRSLVL